eukprot:3272579-Pyramimonas_sp.AAC.1
MPEVSLATEVRPRWDEMRQILRVPVLDSLVPTVSWTVVFDPRFGGVWTTPLTDAGCYVELKECFVMYGDLNDERSSGASTRQMMLPPPLVDVYLAGSRAHRSRL